MEPIVSLLSSMSIESIIITVVAILVAAKALSELLDWCYRKLKAYFDVKDNDEEFRKDVISRFDNVDRQLDEVKESNRQRDKQVENITRSINTINSRLQDSTRSYILDKYHYYVQQLGVIDEAALQDLERRYLYYKNGGGNSFIELRMEELRNLPIITPEKMTETQKRDFDLMRTAMTKDDTMDGR